jgi:hypothetical protein
MKTKKLFGILVLFLCSIKLTSCDKDDAMYTFHYTGLDEFNGDTLYLWRTTADKLKSDKDYGRQPITLRVIKNGEVTFRGMTDTLHLYYIEGKNCCTYFYPESGEITYVHMKDREYSNPNSIANQYKELESDGFPKEASRKFLYTNLQNAMGIYLLDRIGFYPDELEYIYQNCHPIMKDTVSILLSMKRQLEQTSKLEKGARYIDFKQKGFEQDSIHLSDCFRQRREICLFFANDDKKDFIRHIDQLQKKNKDILFVGCTITHLMDKEYIKLLKETYKALLFDDRKRYEMSVMYQYRVDYRKRMNYCLLFDKDGYLKEIYIN